LHFQGEFTKINIWLQMLKHTARDVQTLKHTCKRFPMLKHKRKRFLNKQNYTEKYLRFNTWYTISGVHKYKSDKTLKTLEFLRNESLK